MKTLELMKASEAELAPKLKQMKLKELERHASKILGNLGQPDYDEVMRVVIGAVPKLEGEYSEKLEGLKRIVKGLVPTASNDSVVDDTLIERLAVIIMMIITKKFQKILSEQ